MRLIHSLLPSRFLRAHLEVSEEGVSLGGIPLTRETLPLLAELYGDDWAGEDLFVPGLFPALEVLVSELDPFLSEGQEEVGDADS